jgi:hypothetical protein
VEGEIGQDLQSRFPAAGCNPKLGFLDDLKTVTARTKLNKGNFWLHKSI